MSEGQEQGGVAWERSEAWKLIVAATDAGDSDALQLAWSRYSDAMANGALSAAGAVLIPLDRKITAQANDIAELLAVFRKARDADLDWRADETDRRDKQADRVYDELDRLGDAVRGLGGLSAQVEDHEVRIASLEEHGAPAETMSELHTMRLSNDKRFTRIEIWVACLTVAMFFNAIIYILLASTGGGR